MQERFRKYFWDGKEGWSEEGELRRILEYASFEDMIHYPFEKLKAHISKLNLPKLWTAEYRKEYLQNIVPFIANSNSWEEAHMKMVVHFAKNFHFTISDEQASEVK